MCYLDRSGWVVVQGEQQLRVDIFAKPNWYSCMEPEESGLLDRIKAAQGDGPS
jgi:hypothetical protein